MNREKHASRNHQNLRQWQHRKTPFVLAALTFLTVIFVIILAPACPGYLVRAGRGQLSILWARRDLQAVLNDPATDAKTREKLRHVALIRRFARDKLSLRPGHTYTQFSKIDRPYAAWNVTACKKLALEAKLWSFPIVGRVPYLGFFSEKEAREMAAQLGKEGWDVLMRPVTAYSTLGWFNDPLLSSQLRLSEWSLTRLVIHESVHATLWFPNDTGFNESFASFVEAMGALQFYAERDGIKSRSYRRKEASIRESHNINEHYKVYAGRLHKLFQSSLSDPEKIRGKRKLIQEFRAEFIKFKRSNSIYDYARLANRTYNNADFLSSLRYSSKAPLFHRIFQKNSSSWPDFLKAMNRLSSLKSEERFTGLRKLAK